MTPYYTEPGVELYHGDSLAVLPTFAAERFSSILTDPPYGLSFMGREWDHGVPGVPFWAEALRVCKPGATLMAFGGTRTFHRLTVAIEDAGWEVRDCLMWLYGSGFPKSLDIAKALTKRHDPTKLREIKLWLAEQVAACGKSKAEINRECGFTACDYLKTEPGNDAGGRATWHLLLPHGEKWLRLKAVIGFDDTHDAAVEELARVADTREAPKESRGIYGEFSGTVTSYDLNTHAANWSGWGTALKPAWEPIIVAQKPLDGTFAENALRHGVAGLNIDGGRIGTGVDVVTFAREKGDRSREDYRTGTVADCRPSGQGRWPANVILDEAAAAVLDTAAGERGGSGKASGPTLRNGNTSVARGKFNGLAADVEPTFYGDSGGPSRFFYTAKASRADRGHGNDHPTVKPTDLIRYLLTLTDTPTHGEVLDLFGGSMTTALAARAVGRPCVCIDKVEHHCEIGKRRLMADPVLFFGGGAA